MSPFARERLGLALLSAGVTEATYVHALDLASRLAQTSDSAQSSVEAHAILGGNIFLTGWHFPLDDYYFTDTVPFAAFEWLTGPRPFLLVLVPVLTYALFVLAAFAACIRPSQPLIRNLEAGAALTLLLVAPVWIGSWDPMLQSDIHAATAFGAFIALVLCARIAARERLDIATCTALPLAASLTVASDPFSIVFAFGPALVILATDVLLRTAAPNTRITLLLLSSGVALGLLLPVVIALTNGFTVENDVSTRFIAAPLFGRNLIAVMVSVLSLLGVVPSGLPIERRVLLLLVIRLTALVIAIAAIGRVTWHLFARARAPLFDRLLCAGILTDVAACAASAQFAKGITPQTIWTGGPPMRFLVPAVLFAAVLGARQIPQMIASLPVLPARNAARGMFGLFAAIAVFAGGWLSNIMAQPRWISDSPPAAATRWLEQHGLSQGVGEYWSSNLVTAMSGDAVAVRTVVPQAGRLVPYVWVEDRRFYRRAPQFVIWQDANKTGVTVGDVRATYAICSIEFVAGYRIALLANGGNGSRCPNRLATAERMRYWFARAHQAARFHADHPFEMCCT